MDNNRWRVTDIEVPFKCIVWWLLKFWAAQLVLVLTLWICGLLIFGCLTLLGISLLPNHIPSTAPNLHQKYWP